jgi:hypothetical protein
MEMINIRILWPRLKIMQPYLPRKIFSQIERVFGKPNPTKQQLLEIEQLGESVGLQKNEILAAIDAPLVNQASNGGKSSIYLRLILVSILAIVCILIVWFIAHPELVTIPTYAPGTDYGTIRPQDFADRIIENSA